MSVFICKAYFAGTWYVWGTVTCTLWLTMAVYWNLGPSTGIICHAYRIGQPATGTPCTPSMAFAPSKTFRLNRIWVLLQAPVMKGADRQLHALDKHLVSLLCLGVYLPPFTHALKTLLEISIRLGVHIIAALINPAIGSICINNALALMSAWSTCFVDSIPVSPASLSAPMVGKGLAGNAMCCLLAHNTAPWF